MLLLFATFIHLHIVWWKSTGDFEECVSEACERKGIPCAISAQIFSLLGSGSGLECFLKPFGITVQRVHVEKGYEVTHTTLLTAKSALCTLNSLLLLGVAFAWGFSGSALCWLLSQQKTFTVFTVQQQSTKAQATLESHSMQTRWESNAADCARVGESSRPSGQAEIQGHAALYLQSHSSGENRPRIPQPGCEQHSRYFCSAANNPGPSTVQTGEPVGWHRPSLFAGVSGFSRSAAQGQGVGIVPCGSALAHTQRQGSWHPQLRCSWMVSPMYLSQWQSSTS